MKSSPIDKGHDPLSTMSAPPFAVPGNLDIKPLVDISSYQSSEAKPLVEVKSKPSGFVVSSNVAQVQTNSARHLRRDLEPAARTEVSVYASGTAMAPGSPLYSTNLSKTSNNKTFNFSSLNSAASKLSKYAQTAAYSIKAMAQTAANEVKLSPFAVEVPHNVFDEPMTRHPVPPEWYEKCWQSPRVILLHDPPLLSLNPVEVVKFTFPRALLLTDVKLTSDSVRSTPSLFFAGGEMSAISNEYMYNSAAPNSPTYLLGRALLTSHRIFLDPLTVDKDSYTQRWLIESGLITLDWLEIEQHHVSFRPSYPIGNSPNRISSEGLMSPKSCSDQIENGHCFVDLTLRSGLTVCLVVSAQDCLPLCESFGIGTVADALSHTISQYARPQSVADCGAFRRTDLRFAHLKVFDPVTEYSRYLVQGEILSEAAFHLSEFNRHFDVCPTYPALLPLPRTMNEQFVRAVAAFRTRGRLPIMAWRDSETGTSLWRSSQPQSAFSRSYEDEMMVCEEIRLGSKTEERPIIFDARPFVNAVANKFTGAGYEDVNTYENCKIEFASIENIQKVTDSYNSVLKTLAKDCTSFKVVEFKDRNTGHVDKTVVEVEWCQPSSLLAKIYGSGWLDHVLTLLRAASRIARHLSETKTVLVHCSDGWDRTAQLSALAQILVDPYFRTLKGFCVLVEKEFVWMGHKFATRCGHPLWFDSSAQHEEKSFRTTPSGNLTSSTDLKSVPKKQVSPIFCQWLDCVWQIQHQFPHKFEFDERFLVALASSLHTSRFGDFMFNNEEHRLSLQQKGYTWDSIWERVMSQANMWKRNVVNDVLKTSQSDLLPLDTHVCSIRFWKAYWFSIRPREFGLYGKSRANEPHAAPPKASESLL